MPRNPLDRRRTECRVREKAKGPYFFQGWGHNDPWPTTKIGWRKKYGENEKKYGLKTKDSDDILRTNLFS